jgi:hypothetical protein
MFNTKSAPKSCSCDQCKRGKGTRSGKKLMKLDERVFRHASKISLNKGEPAIYAAPMGGYYD